MVRLFRALRAPLRSAAPAAALACAVLVGCTQYQPVKGYDPSGRRYTVRTGDTVGVLAERFGVSWREIARANQLRNPDLIMVGQVLVIPRGGGASGPRAYQASSTSLGWPARGPEDDNVSTSSSSTGAPLGARDPATRGGGPRPLVWAQAPPPTGAANPAPGSPPAAPPGGGDEPPPAMAPETPQPAPIPRPRPAAPAAVAIAAVDQAAVRRAAKKKPPSLSGDGFLWPVAGRVLDDFGAKANGQRNDGINIAAPAGTPIVAAENGVVVYAGDSIPGFGKMLLLRHADGFTTAYAHASRLEVALGDTVRRGAVIARVGTTGGVTDPQLHFELRAGKQPLDPEGHLGGRPSMVASSAGGTS